MSIFDALVDEHNGWPSGGGQTQASGQSESSDPGGGTRDGYPGNVREHDVRPNGADNGSDKW